MIDAIVLDGYRVFVIYIRVALVRIAEVDTMKYVYVEICLDRIRKYQRHILSQIK